MTENHRLSDSHNDSVRSNDFESILTTEYIRDQHKQIQPDDYEPPRFRLLKVIAIEQFMWLIHEDARQLVHSHNPQSIEQVTKLASNYGRIDMERANARHHEGRGAK